MTDNTKTIQQKITIAMKEYEKALRAEFELAMKNWPQNLQDKAVSRVLCSLLARQITITIYIVNDPNLWNPHVGPLLLRTLLENWLKIEWILLSPQQRSSGIAKADLIGAKARLEQMASVTKEESAKEHAKELIAMMEREEAMFSSQAKTIMIDVRDMAKKAGGKALIAYRRHGVHFGACAHSSWHHLARFNLIIDPNPLHRYLFVPMWEEFLSVDPNYALLAAEYCSNAMDAILEPSQSNHQKSYAQLLTDLQTLGIFENLPIDFEGET